MEPPFTEYGRYVFVGSVLKAVSDDPTETERLWKAWCRHGGSERVQFTPGVTLEYIGQKIKGGVDYAGCRLLIWSDDKVHIGTLYPEREGDATLAEAAEWLIRQAIHRKYWHENQAWRRFLSVVDVEKREIATDGKRTVTIFSSSSWDATTYELRITHTDGVVEFMYWGYLSAGSLGEDGDAWEESAVFETRAEVDAWLEEQRQTYT